MSISTANVVTPAPILAQPGLVKVGRDEHWCMRCGEVVGANGVCGRCGSRRCVPAVQVLRPEEFYLAG